MSGNILLFISNLLSKFINVNRKAFGANDVNIYLTWTVKFFKIMHFVMI